eukprot:16370605-Heterocapsa_arctica.AAC.1
MGDAALKRATDTKSITEKEGTKVNTEGSLEQEKDKKTPLIKVLLATVDYKSARANEIEALESTKVMLNSAGRFLRQTG